MADWRLPVLDSTAKNVPRKGSSKPKAPAVGTHFLCSVHRRQCAKDPWERWAGQTTEGLKDQSKGEEGVL